MCSITVNNVPEISEVLKGKPVNIHCKGTVKRRTPTKGGEQDMKFIPEGDLYALLFAMQLQKANNEG